MNTKLRILLFISLFIPWTFAFAQDPNFYIFLCFGQSNMEGNAKIESQDTLVDGRFQVLESVNCPNLNRTIGNWYPAIPPLCRCYTGISPVDYFGRTMVEELPDSIKIGIINVSVAGCRIELFDRDHFETYADTAPVWMKNIIKEYGGNPYSRLVEMAKLAQNNGVIKGVLLHQGESNPNDTLWPQKVKTIYYNLLNDLKLTSKDVPLLAGELVNADQGGACANMNLTIGKLPETIPDSYVISSAGCPHRGDKLHFSIDGYRILGQRFAVKMLLILHQ